MRRKSERAASKKTKASPDKKAEKPKRTRSSKRRKQSSSENESDESSPECEVVESVKSDVPTPQTPENDSKQDQDQVWHVKAADSSGDSGEIHKLKICLARPPSTPEKADKSPRSKRKHSRATSSSDSQSVEAVEEKRKSRHHSRHSTVDSKDSDRTNEESQEEVEAVQEQQLNSNAVQEREVPMSTTNEEVEAYDIESSQQSARDGNKSKTDADSTVNSVKPQDTRREDCTQLAKEESKEKIADSTTLKSPNTSLNIVEPQNMEAASSENKVSKCEDNLGAKNVSEDVDSSNNEDNKANVDADVVELSETAEIEELQKMSSDSGKGEEELTANKKKIQRSESHQSMPDESIPNGHAAPIVINRKRKWGSRPGKLTTQKSITISTDILKEIIPDVKPTAFDEVIEEKKQKHKRVEVERVERPVLPKIVIDNTEQIEKSRDINEEKENSKYREPNLGANRKISIVKENDSILARPPSPPRHKQSNILYITNLVRPFTLPQLKNLLQRTGRIVEDGFWIDKIKSKCFVKYETEDQAVETRHALHGVTWPVSNPKTLQVDFSTQEAFEKTKTDEETNGAPISAIPGNVEDWIRDQELKRGKEEIVDKPWERKASVREWDVGKNEKERERERDRFRRDERGDRRRVQSGERSPEPGRKFKKKEEEPPAKLLDDLFRKTKTAPCIYWLPLTEEMIAIKEEQRRQQLAEHERRMLELRRDRRR